jgi:hypothetical protein
MTPGDETEDYSSADEIELPEDPRQAALDATREDELRAMIEREIRQKKENETRSHTVKARVVDRGVALARHVANVVSPGKKVTIRLKRRGELGGRGVKKYTKKQVKADGKHKQNKHTKRQPKRRD